MNRYKVLLLFTRTGTLLQIKLHTIVFLHAKTLVRSCIHIALIVPKVSILKLRLGFPYCPYYYLIIFKLSLQWRFSALTPF